MSSLKNRAKNAFVVGIVNNIVSHLAKCSQNMKADCLTGKRTMLKNKENDITNRLTADYLNAKPNNLRFIPEASEHFDEATDSYIGRVDIKVFRCDHFQDDISAYFNIECKRIDGEYNLNKKYVSEGVSRFFYPIPFPKYSSYYKRNIVFGYVVQAINVIENTNEIECLQHCLLSDVSASGFTLLPIIETEYCVYECEYISLHTGKIALSHLFFNFSDVVQGG